VGGNSPQRRCILIVEDEFLLAVMLADDLHAAGFQILGPFSDLRSARQAASNENFDLAILDININGEMVYPLARELMARGAPFVFLSGYGPSDLPEQFRSAPRISKPALLIMQIRRYLAQRD
jgi:DNA-binding NarL/FixJ family response regulator